MNRLDLFIGLPPSRPGPGRHDPPPERIRELAEQIRADNLAAMREGRDYRKRWSRGNVAAGLCSQCKAPQAPGLSMCMKHIEAQRERQRKRKEP